MRRLLGAVHDDIDARGEPLAALTASEGGIYERFGYGIATRRRTIAIDRRAGPAAPAAPAGRDGAHRRPVAALPEIMEVWDRYRVRRAGEIGRPEAWFRADIARNPDMVHAAARRRVRLVADRAPRLERRPPRARAVLITMAPVTPEAHVALWYTVLSIDLVGTIRSSAVAPDDPLPFLLTDQRAVRTTDLERRRLVQRARRRRLLRRPRLRHGRRRGRRGRRRPLADRRRRRRARCAPGPTSSPTGPGSARCCSGAWPRPRSPPAAAWRPRPPRCAAPTPCSSSTRPRTPRPASDRPVTAQGTGSRRNHPVASTVVSDRISTADVVHVARWPGSG